jgi:hypothetical protein
VPRIEDEPTYAHTSALAVVHRGEVVLDRRFGAGDELVDTYSITISRGS